jgi:hypothetical protein
MLKPMLHSLKLVTNPTFFRSQDCIALLRSTLRMYSMDIVQDDLDALVAILLLTPPELARQVVDTIKDTVDLHVVNQPLIL